MEVSSAVIALISILGSLLVCMISLLIAMVFGLRKDFDKRSGALSTDIGACKDDLVTVKLRLMEMVPWQDHNRDMQAIDVKLDEHGAKILRLEIKVINGVSR